ncbi:MAG: hypothetical protein OIF35_12430, partial [Cellvibrionaceae bacterium]|nr:hypothetical protein [Cellvibrionaceae bacterium]
AEDIDEFGWRCQACHADNSGEYDSCYQCGEIPFDGASRGRQWQSIPVNQACAPELMALDKNSVLNQLHSPALLCPQCKLAMYVADKFCLHCGHYLTPQEVWALKLTHERQVLRGVAAGAVFFTLLLVVFVMWFGSW